MTVGCWAAGRTGRRRRRCENTRSSALTPPGTQGNGEHWSGRRQHTMGPRLPNPLLFHPCQVAPHPTVRFRTPEQLLARTARHITPLAKALLTMLDSAHHQVGPQQEGVCKGGLVLGEEGAPAAQVRRPHHDHAAQQAYAAAVALHGRARGRWMRGKGRGIVQTRRQEGRGNAARLRAGLRASGLARRNALRPHAPEEKPDLNHGKEAARQSLHAPYLKTFRE